MARKQIVKDIPPLPEVFAAFPGFGANDSRQQALTVLLRNAARSLQQKEPRSFYSMREIAAFFSVPLRTVALSYEVLDLEGLLSRIRGSQTMLAGLKASSRKPVNAIIGLPISLQALISSPFECYLQMELEERLRARGYVADSIFFRPNEDYEPDFADRLLRHNLDAVIWHSPHPLSSHVLLSLRERGVKLILLQPSETPLRLPARTHLLHWQTAYRTMAADWAARGIRRAFIPEPENLLARRALKQLTPILAENGITLTVIEPTESSLTLHLLPAPEAVSTATAETAVRENVLAFIDVQTADTLCNGFPGLVEKICDRARLAFCRGAVRVPRLTTRRLCVDIVDLDPATLAEGVVEDLCDPHNKQEGTRHTFAAVYHPQIIPGATPGLF